MHSAQPKQQIDVGPLAVPELMDDGRPHKPPIVTGSPPVDDREQRRVPLHQRPNRRGTKGVDGVPPALGNDERLDHVSEKRSVHDLGVTPEQINGGVGKLTLVSLE
jgi:hypothetical protein